MTDKRRMQSQTERDMEGLAAKREREAAPEEFAGEEDSMAHEVPVRKVIRGKRDTKERLEKLEEFKDQALADIGEMKVSLAEVRGESKAQTVALKSIEKYMARAEQRENAEHAAKVEIDKAEALDGIDARKAKRALIYKLLGGGTVLGVIVTKLLGYAGVL